MIALGCRVQQAACLLLFFAVHREFLKRLGTENFKNEFFFTIGH